MQAEHTFPKQPKAITQDMRDRKEKRTGLQMQLNAVLLNAHKLLNQSLSPYQCLNIHCVCKEETQQEDCNKVKKKRKKSSPCSQLW